MTCRGMLAVDSDLEKGVMANRGFFLDWQESIGTGKSLGESCAAQHFAHLGTDNQSPGQQCAAQTLGRLGTRKSLGEPCAANTN